MPNPCVWPTSYRTRCGQRCEQGQICPMHMKLVEAQFGTRDCAWPGCPTRIWDQGLCPFHMRVARRDLAWAKGPRQPLGTH
jgi:hypothetical protein